MKNVDTVDELLTRISVLEQELTYLQERNKKLVSAVETSPAIIVITDREGNIEYANPSFTETGYTIEEVFGRNPRLLQSGVHPPAFYEALWDTLKAGNVWDGEFCNKRKDGRLYWEHARIAPIKNELEEITNYVAVKFDITQQKEFEKQLRANEEKFRNIFSLAPLVIVFFDLDFKLIDCNNQFLSYLSIVDKSQIIGKSILDLLPPDEREKAKQDLGKTLIQKFSTNLEYYLYVNGEKRCIELSTSLVCDEDHEPRYIIAIIRDVTQLKQAEQKLKELVATKDKFFSIIANHLKNPFSAIVGFSSILSENSNNYKPEQIQHIASVINDSASRAAGLIENLLNWSLTQTGSLEFHPQKLILCQVINDTIRDLKKQAIEKTISVINGVPELMEAYAEIIMLKTIMRILLNNAIKYSDVGGKVTINAVSHLNSIEIMVTDMGVGIPQEVLEKLFLIDSRYNTIGTSQEQGIGLGLILCKDLIEKHGGNIKVKSTVGKGSEFMVILPKGKS